MLFIYRELGLFFVVQVDYGGKYWFFLFFGNKYLDGNFGYCSVLDLSGEKYWRVIIYYYMEFFNVGVDDGVCYDLFIIFIFVYGFGDILFRIREQILFINSLIGLQVVRFILNFVVVNSYMQ